MGAPTIEEIKQNPAIIGFLSAYLDLIKKIQKAGKLDLVLNADPSFRYDPYKAAEEAEQRLRQHTMERWGKKQKAV